MQKFCVEKNSRNIGVVIRVTYPKRLFIPRDQRNRIVSACSVLRGVEFNVYSGELAKHVRVGNEPKPIAGRRLRRIRRNGIAVKESSSDPLALGGVIVDANGDDGIEEERS